MLTQIKNSNITRAEKRTHGVAKTGIIDPLKNKPRRNNDESPVVDTAASLVRIAETDELDMIAELLSKYTPLKEYRSVLTEFVTKLPEGSIIQESDLLELAASLGYTPNPADIDRVILDCNRLIKKTFIGKPGQTEIVAFKRFNSR